MSSPTTNSIPISRMFVKDQITVSYAEKSFGEDSEKKKPGLMLYLLNNNNRVFCFLPVPLFVNNEATF